MVRCVEGLATGESLILKFSAISGSLSIHTIVILQWVLTCLSRIKQDLLAALPIFSRFSRILMY